MSRESWHYYSWPCGAIPTMSPYRDYNIGLRLLLKLKAETSHRNHIPNHWRASVSIDDDCCHFFVATEFCPYMRAGISERIRRDEATATTKLQSCNFREISCDVCTVATLSVKHRESVAVRTDFGTTQNSTLVCNWSCRIHLTPLEL